MAELGGRWLGCMNGREGGRVRRYSTLSPPRLSGAVARRAGLSLRNRFRGPRRETNWIESKLAAIKNTAVGNVRAFILAALAGTLGLLIAFAVVGVATERYATASLADARKKNIWAKWPLCLAGCSPPSPALGWLISPCRARNGKDAQGCNLRLVEAATESEPPTRRSVPTGGKVYSRDLETSSQPPISGAPGPEPTNPLTASAAPVPQEHPQQAVTMPPISGLATREHGPPQAAWVCANRR